MGLPISANGNLPVLIIHKHIVNAHNPITSVLSCESKVAGSAIIAQGVYRTRPKMAMSIPGTRTPSGWSEYHSTFMRMGADRCVDKERLKALAVQITDIDAFHRVGQVSK